MPKEREEKKITRRQFLTGGAALVGGALLSGCGPTKEPSSAQKPSPQTETNPSVSPTPTAEKIPTTVPSPEPTVTPESTPTQEVLKIPGVVLNEEYLGSAFANVGGGEAVKGGQQETTMAEFGQNYVGQTWGEKIDFASLSGDSTASLKYLISLGAYQGAEGVFTPGRRGEEIIFPQLAELSLARLTLNKIPSESDQENQEFREWTSPQNFLLHSGTQVTVVGVFKEPHPAEATIVDKGSNPEEELDYALVAFTDYLRAGEDNIPRHYLAVLPTRFPADPDNKQASSLANLLEANGYHYDHQNKEIVFDEGGRQVRLGLNNLEGEELIEKAKQEIGIYFVDQLKGEIIKNPVVPYPDEMPEAWKIEEQESEGEVSLLLQSQEEGGTFQDFARARYDREKEEWVWERTEGEPDLETGEVLIGQEFIALPEKKILELLSLPENKEKMILPAYPSPETRLTVEPYKDKYGEHKMILISGLDERTLFNPTVEGVRFSTIIQGSGGSDNITYSSALFFLKGNGFIIEVDNQPEVEFNAIKPEEEDDITFGTILASNIQKRTLPRYGENDLCVFCSSEPVGDNPMEYLLRYKGKIVARFSSVLITSKNSTSTVG